MKKYWYPCIFEDGTELEIGKDGLIFRCKLELALELFLQGKQYTSLHNGWWWNDSKDRLCAELEGNQVVINPSIVIAKLGNVLATDIPTT